MEPSLNQENVPFTPESNVPPLSFGEANFIFEGCSEADTHSITSEMIARILYFAECGYATFLPSFGIIFPLDKTITLTDSKDKTFVIRSVTIRTLGFEKTDELYTSHRLQFPKLLELRDLTDSVFERIKTKMSHSVPSANHLRKMLRKYWRNFRSCLISSGHDLSSPDVKFTLGRFFASHNRQGASEQECFAGSDISLVPAWQKVLGETQSNTFERPVLQNSFEIASAVLGAPIHKFTLSIRNIVKELNYDLSDIGPGLPETIEVESYIKRISERRLEIFFVSNGIRSCASPQNDKSIGNEFIIKIPLHHREPQQAEQLSFELAHCLPKDAELAFTYGALLSLASRTGNAPDGSAIPLDASESELSNGAIASFDFKTVGQLQLTGDVPFYLKSLVFLHPVEAELIPAGKKSVLVHFLHQKGYDQAFDIKRPSVLHKTFVL